MRPLLRLFKRANSPSVYGMPMQKAIACGLVPEYRVGKWIGRWNRLKLWWNPNASVKAKVLAHYKNRLPESEISINQSALITQGQQTFPDAMREQLDINQKCMDNGGTKAARVISALIMRGVLPKDRQASPMTYEALLEALNSLDAVPPTSSAELEMAQVPPTFSEFKRAVDPQLSKVFDDAGFPKHEDTMPPMPGGLAAGPGEGQTDQGQKSE